MSLINQMLQDLEARRAFGGEAVLPNDVRPLPSSKPSAMPKILTGIVALLVFTSGFLWWSRIASILQSQTAVGEVKIPLSLQVQPSVSPSLLSITDESDVANSISIKPAPSSAS